MKVNKALVNAAIAGVISIGISASVTAKPPAMEKCYGIVKAGKNDCGVPGANACAAQAKADGLPNDWIFVPKGTCEKIVGGSTKPKTSGANQGKTS